MSEPLIIWLPEDLDEAWAYHHSPADQGWAASDSERNALSAKAANGCVVVCPGTWFRTYPHALPEMKASERLSAAGFAIEEKLASSLSEQFIILGHGDDQRIGLISHDLMQKMLNALDSANIMPTQIIAEYEAFPADSGTLICWSRTIHPGPLGYSLDADTDGDNPLSLVPQMQFMGALNYAQGRYARRKNRFSGLHAYRALAASLLIAGFAWLLWQGSQTRAMNQQAENLKAEAAELYTQATGRPAPANPSLAVTRELRRSGNSSADFLTLSQTFMSGLRQVEGVSIETLRYNADRGNLTFKLIYPSFQTAAQLEQIFDGGAGTFNSGTVREQNEELIGEGTFSLGGGA